MTPWLMLQFEPVRVCVCVRIGFALSRSAPRSGKIGSGQLSNPRAGNANSLLIITDRKLDFSNVHLTARNFLDSDWSGMVSVQLLTERAGSCLHYTLMRSLTQEHNR